MNPTDLSQLFDSNQLLLDSSLGSLQILISLSATFVMAMFVYWVYKKTYNGVLYSKNFNITLVMVAIAINAIVIGISGNLMLSLGMIGALSIIRFRTAVKDPRDTAFIFWAITIGIANGVEYYQLSLIASGFIAIVLWGLSRSFTFEPSYMLILKYQNSDQWPAVLQQLDDKQLVQSHFIRSDTLKNGVIEKVIELRIQRGQQESLLNQLRSLDGIATCTLLSSHGEFTE
ncbi:DUF4956 domain-containing protein [Oceanobacter kriegii]|uniref:DUF4956 domain-containing protein n=1 Tax=Oceanobacter kriegii TaxID=64972 RepID=UPI00040E5264|nr:DUF4956 domain-containing protein [Oceanobacter kriegii]